MSIEKLLTNYASNFMPEARTSRGDLDEINPEEIIYGEYVNDSQAYGEWIDLVYLGDDIIRTFSGPINSTHRVIDELKLLLRDDEKFYVVPVREVPRGFAFKRTDIVGFKHVSTIDGNENHPPSCIWGVIFDNGRSRTIETDFQAYFTYGNTTRPNTMTNMDVLEKIL